MKFRTIGRCLLASALPAAVTVIISATPAEAAACAPDSAAAWATCDESANDGTMIVEDVTYAGPIGSVGGRVCRPVTPGPHPILVMNHGAGKDFAKDDSTINGSCEQRAREGWYVIASDYRPNEFYGPSPTSDVCLGEVDDVVAMIDVARTVSFADDSRIGMRGISLGGCVTLKIHQQGVPGLIAAATINGMSDVEATRNHARAKFNQFLCGIPLLHPYCGAWRNIFQWIEHATGGVPGQATQAAYDVRSPITQADDAAASTVPLALIQGADDQLIPPGQTCAFAAAVNGQPGGTWDFTPIHYGTQSAGYPVLATAPASCPGQGTWYTGSTPYPAFPGDHYLAIVDGFDHVLPAQVLDDAELWVDAFLASKL